MAKPEGGYHYHIPQTSFMFENHAITATIAVQSAMERLRDKPVTRPDLRELITGVYKANGIQITLRNPKSLEPHITTILGSISKVLEPTEFMLKYGFLYLDERDQKGRRKKLSTYQIVNKNDYEDVDNGAPASQEPQVIDEPISMRRVIAEQENGRTKEFDSTDLFRNAPPTDKQVLAPLQQASFENPLTKSEWKDLLKAGKLRIDLNYALELASSEYGMKLLKRRLPDGQIGYYRA